MDNQTNDTAGDDMGVVVVRQFGLMAPLDWGDDVTSELWRMNQLWNRLVEIERENRRQYNAIIDQSAALAEIAPRIELLTTERGELIAERNRRRAEARSKKGAETADIDSRLGEINLALAPLWAERKKHAAAARREMKPQLDALEAERKESVKEHGRTRTASGPTTTP